MKSLIPVFLWFVCCQIAPAHAVSYGVARSAAPVLNTPAFTAVFGGVDAKTLKTDRCDQVRELEFIALPGTVFRILEELRDAAVTVYRVETDDYAASATTSLYVDSRFVERREARPPPRLRKLPPRQAVIDALHAAAGSSYVWGGNLQEGSTQLLELFYGAAAASREKNRLSLAGLDCSGLLYQATDGWTPRNTSQLVSYGVPVPVAGASVDDIAKRLEPLDLIVWNGHVVVVLDRETVIESRLECGKPGNGGVVTTPLKRRLSEVMRKRRPVDGWPATGKPRDEFVVRRWFIP